MDGSRQSQAVLASAAFTAGIASILMINVLCDVSYLSCTLTANIRRRMAKAFHTFANTLSLQEYCDPHHQSVDKFEYRDPDIEEALEFENYEKVWTKEEVTVEPIYRLPSWFLKNCVMTLEDLRTSEIPLRFHEVATSGEKKEEIFYEMDETVFDQLRTTIQQKAPSTTVQSSFQHDATVLRTPVTHFESAEGFHHAILKRLAVEMGADMVTLRKMDIRLLCEHFALDKPHTPKRDQAFRSFFGTPGTEVEYSSRRRKIFDRAYGELQSNSEGSHRGSGDYTTSDKTELVFPFPLLLESPILKRSTANETSVIEDQERRPLIIILSEVFSISSSHAWGNVLAQLRDAVGLANSHSLRTMIVGSASFVLGKYTFAEDIFHDGFPPISFHELVDSTPTPTSSMSMLSLLGSKPLCVQAILPRQTSGQQSLLNKHEEGVRLRHNITMLQNSIRHRLGVDFACDLLEPYAIWDVDQSSSGLDILRGPELDTPTCDFVAGAIQGDVSIERIVKILDQRSTVLQTLRDRLNDRDSIDSLHVQTEWSDFPKSVQDAIKKIQSHPMKYEWERILLDQLVNPRDTKFTWVDIELEDDVKRAITQIVDLANSKSHSQSGILRHSRINGALLYGPPGTGKTHLARVLAREYNTVMIHASAAELESKWVGETEKIIKALFNLASMVVPSIIFIDEADALFRKRQSDDSSYVRSRTNTFLGETDGLLKRDRPPFLLIATNHPNDLDEAVLRRVPGRLYIGMPKLPARSKMLDIFLREEILDPEMRLSDIAAMTGGFSGSDLRNLCVQAALLSQTESREKQQKDHQRILRFAHFEEAMRRCAPTVSSDAIDAMREFARKFDTNAMDKVGHSYSEADVAKRKQGGKKAPRGYERGTADQLPSWMKSDDVETGVSGILSFDEWKDSDLYPYVTEELCQKWWQDSQETNSS